MMNGWTYDGCVDTVICGAFTLGPTGRADRSALRRWFVFVPTYETGGRTSSVRAAGTPGHTTYDTNNRSRAEPAVDPVLHMCLLSFTKEVVTYTHTRTRARCGTPDHSPIVIASERACGTRCMQLHRLGYRTTCLLGHRTGTMRPARSGRQSIANRTTLPRSSDPDQTRTRPRTDGRITRGARRDYSFVPKLRSSSLVG